MRLVVGLGNPGQRFAGTRHNLGFLCVDRMARGWDIRLSERRAKVVLGIGQVHGLGVVLAKPRTFMNNSGEAVRYLLARFGATPADLMVIYDDMDLPVGRIRIRPRGRGAGHNGVQSVIDAVGTEEFPRVRVGIDKPPEGVEGVDHVLRSFRPEEVRLAQEAVERVGEAVASVLLEGLDAAMNKWNREMGPSSPDIAL